MQVNGRLAVVLMLFLRTDVLFPLGAVDDDVHVAPEGHAVYEVEANAVLQKGAVNGADELRRCQTFAFFVGICTAVVGKSRIFSATYWMISPSSEGMRTKMLPL